MKKIINSIQKVLAKIEGIENRYSATIRQDVVRRAIERGEFLKIKCAYHYTDDYAWDAVNNHGKKDSVSQETMLHEYSILTPSCWVDKKIHTIDGVDCYEISVNFHQNLAYDMYVPVNGENNPEPEAESEPTVEEEILDYSKAEYAISEEKEIDWIEEKKLIHFKELEVLPENLREEILKDIIGNFEWIKMKYLTREEAIDYINKYGIMAECEVNGIHGQKACLKLMGSDVWNNTFNLKYFSHVFQKGEPSQPIMKTIEISFFGSGRNKTWTIREKTLHSNGNTLFDLINAESQEDAVSKSNEIKNTSGIPVQIINL